jgi:5-hydroxyisourate hydrolase-like protein (transthyretin family)
MAQMKLCASLALSLTTAALCVGALLPGAPAGAATAPTSPEPTTASAPPEPKLVPVAATGCASSPTAREATCLAQVRPATGVAAPAPTTPDASTVAAPLTVRNKTESYTPSDLASLYRIPAGLTPDATVGIVDVGSDPNTLAQMSYYRSYFHLPACTVANGCFREVAQDGSSNLPGTNSDWVTEIALDVQAVSAICPTCHILLVDANSASITDMAKATLTATKLGAQYVSLSFGSDESSAATSLRNTYYSNPDVTYVAAAGDSGYSGGALFPASAANVVAAGGTSVTLVNGTWQQRAWSGSGSGCSSLQSITSPQAQQNLSSMCRGRRVVSDVSALADPDTGMLFYRGGTWWNAGGTSLATPIITSLYALAGNHTSPMSVYHAGNALVDVTAGSTGSCSPASLCTAGPGWDGPTGLGTPAGLAGLAADGTTVPTYSTPTVGVLNGGRGYPVKLSYRLADTVTGAPVGSVPVFLQRRRADGSYATIRTARTRADGTAVFTDAPRGVSSYRVVFSGNGDHAASTSSALTVAGFTPKVSVRQHAGRLSAAARAPWGGPAQAVPVRLQQRHGRWWVTVSSTRTNARGAAQLRVRAGATYRLQFGGGGGWATGTTTVRVR